MPENTTEERPPQLDNVRDNATQEDLRMNTYWKYTKSVCAQMILLCQSRKKNNRRYKNSNMKSLIFFIIGFALALAVLFLWNLQYFRQRRKKRKEELQEHPERKTSATKIIIFSILATYYIAFAVGVWVVVTKDFYQLSVLLTFVGGVTAAAVAFYCWKAKAENLLKIKAAYPELSGTLSDFSSMTQ